MVSSYLERPLRSLAQALADRAKQAAELRRYLAERAEREGGL